MRKILSVVLVVVMLAAMATVFPTSAASLAPELVITEIAVDSYLYHDSDNGGGDAYEFIELFNAGDTAIDLYNYSLGYFSVNAGSTNPATADTALGKFAPICSPETMKAVGNTLGTISTSAQQGVDEWKLYPSNPAVADTDAHTLQPGETAVIWLYTFDAFALANLLGRPLTFDDFKEYYYMDASTKVLAIDSTQTNGEVKAVSKDGEVEKTVTLAGANNSGNDLLSTSGLYPSANGRFNGSNSGRRMYAVIDNDGLKAEGALGDFKISSDYTVSYVYVSYENDGMGKNLLQATVSKKDSGSNASSFGAGSFTYNFKYTNSKSDYEINKNENNVKYGDWDVCRYPNPGVIFKAQIDAFEELGATVADSSVYKTKAYPVDPDSSIEYILYNQSFYGMADSTDSDAVIEALGWKRSTRLNNGGTAVLAIENEKLVVTNLDIDLNENGNLTDEGDLDSTDSLFTLFPSLKMEKIARSNYIIEYDLVYTAAQEGNRYVSAIYNYDDRLGYDVFILRVRGTANNQRRLRDNDYITYDVANIVLSATNDDSKPEYTSIVNKITDGNVKAGADKSTNPEDFKLLNMDIRVKYEVDPFKGTKYYINDVLVSELHKDSQGYTYWGSQFDGRDFSVGFIFTQRVSATIDNIRITGYINNYTENDILRAYDQAELKEPATGDATIYVVIAMAVSFISLATLVVAKRRRNEN